VTLDHGQVFTYAYHLTYSFKGRPTPCKRILCCSAHVLGCYRRLRSITRSDYGPGAIPCDQGLHPRDPLGGNALRCTYSLFCAIEDLWNATLSMMKQVPKRRSTLQTRSRNFDLYMLLSCKPLSHIPLKTIAPMVKFRVRDRFPYKTKSQEPFGAYPLRRITLLSTAVSSLAKGLEDLSFQWTR